MTERQYKEHRIGTEKEFDKAYDNGRLSPFPNDETYASDFIYVFTDASGKDQFQHRITWKYLP